MGDVVYVEKSHVLHLGKNNKNFSYTMNGSILKSTNKEKDIGAIVSSNLKSSAQCDKVARTVSCTEPDFEGLQLYGQDCPTTNLLPICEASPRVCCTGVVPLAEG